MENSRITVISVGGNYPTGGYCGEFQSDRLLPVGTKLEVVTATPPAAAPAPAVPRIEVCCQQFDTCRNQCVPLVDHLRGQIKELKSAPAAGGWLPIETAPKDGTAVLVMRDIWPGTKSGRAEECNGYNTYVAEWWARELGDGGGVWMCYMDRMLEPQCPIEPTHWMPLPAPPCATPAAPSQPVTLTDEEIEQMAVDSEIVFRHGKKLLTPFLEHIDLRRNVNAFARAIIAALREKEQAK